LTVICVHSIKSNSEQIDHPTQALHIQFIVLPDDGLLRPKTCRELVVLMISF